MNILFEPVMALPAGDFDMFKACNDAPRNWTYKQQFYTVKNQMLLAYAAPAGFDKQIIKQSCWTCNGTGWYTSDSRCRSCYGDGVYQIRTYWLKRFVLNGELFHRPVEAAEVDGRIMNVINGLVHHDTPSVEPNFAYAHILKKYSPMEFPDFLREFRRRFDKADMKRWGEISAAINRKGGGIMDALQEWYGVKFDDLPF